jgi:hypothetical protein
MLSRGGMVSPRFVAYTFDSILADRDIIILEETETRHGKELMSCLRMQGIFHRVVHQEAKLASAQSVKSGSFKLKPVGGSGRMCHQILSVCSRRTLAKD